MGRVAALSTGEKRLIGQLIVIAAIAVGAVVAIGSYAEQAVLKAEAARRSARAGAFLRDNLPNLKGILGSGRIATEDLALLRNASLAGEAFRYRVYGPQGQVILASRGDDVGKRDASPEFDAVLRQGQASLLISRMGEAGSQIDALGSPYGEASRVVARHCEPVMQGSIFLGAIEVFLDMTPLHERLGANSRVALGGLLVLLALTGLACAAFLRWNAGERRRFIERFEDARARAESLGQQVKAMLGDLAAAEEEKMRRLVGLADGISHELRNPLAILNMGLDSLEASRRPPGGSASDALLADMRGALGRMGGFVHHLGALSIEHGKTEAEVDVNETLRGLAGVVQLNMRTSSAALSLDLSPSVAALWLPHQPVTLALFIILNAAAEQVHETGGSIEVETRMHAEEDAVGIRVATSAPLGEEALPHPLDTSSSGWKDPALDTAARIIQSLGGSTRLSRRASGAELCAVTLPAAVASQATPSDRDLDHSSS